MPNLGSALKSNREPKLFKTTGNVITMPIDDEYIIKSMKFHMNTNKWIRLIIYRNAIL